MDAFDASRHPDVISQSKSKDAVQKDFFRNFDVSHTVEGKIHRDDFYNYYSKISACIPDDFQFETQIKNVWRISNRLVSYQGSTSFKPSTKSSPRSNTTSNTSSMFGRDVAGYPSVERAAEKRIPFRYETKGNGASISTFDSHQQHDHRAFNDAGSQRQQHQQQVQHHHSRRNESPRQFENSSPRFEEMEQPYSPRPSSPRQMDDFPMRSLGASVNRNNVRSQYSRERYTLL